MHSVETVLWILNFDLFLGQQKALGYSPRCWAAEATRSRRRAAGPPPWTVSCRFLDTVFRFCFPSRLQNTRFWWGRDEDGSYRRLMTYSGVLPNPVSVLSRFRVGEAKLWCSAGEVQ